MQEGNFAAARRALLLAGAAAPLGVALAGNEDTATIALFGTAAIGVEGSGKVVEEPRELAGFNRVIVQGPLKVVAKAADVDRVVVRADDTSRR